MSPEQRRGGVAAQYLTKPPFVILFGLPSIRIVKQGLVINARSENDETSLSSLEENAFIVRTPSALTAKKLF